MHALQVALTLVPLKEETPGWAAQMTRTSLRLAVEYNSMELRIEDPMALRSGRPYVVGGLLPWPLCGSSVREDPAMKTAICTNPDRPMLDQTFPGPARPVTDG